MSQYLIETRHLSKYFKTKHGMLHAVEDVSVGIGVGKTLGVVGESGCGKTTLGRTIMQLYQPSGGEILFNGENLLAMPKREARRAHVQMQMIFQDPYTSLNPRMNVQELIARPLKVNRTYKSKADTYRRVLELMELAGISKRLAGAYPHELDGGRRQRIGIARALALNPRFIVCDEPVSALDVSIQAQILNLLMDIQDEMGLTYMFITHDLSVVKHISNEILVMYMGKCVEKASSEELFESPLHPYTRALLSSIPVPKAEMRFREIMPLKGEVTSPIEPKPGCRFAPRCERATEDCIKSEIPFDEVRTGHWVACCQQPHLNMG